MLIIAREYRTRVCRKSFLLLTFLMPLLLVGIVMVPLWLSQAESDTVRTVVVVDASGLYADAFRDTTLYRFCYTSAALPQAREGHADADGFLYLSGDLSREGSRAVYYSSKQADAATVDYLGTVLNRFVGRQKVESYNIPDLQKIIRDTQTGVRIATVKWDADGEETVTSAEVAALVGMLSAFLIYMFIVLYGAQVMSGVVQEKSNRIMEVMVSSVRPFQLMMGKIVGIALVGLTQFLLWVLLIGICSAMVFPMLAGGADTAVLAAADTAEVADASASLAVLEALRAVNVAELLVLFVAYFLGGYLLYASFFAAFGSAVDNETDTQQFSLVLTIPVLFAMYAAIYSAQNPDGPLAFWCSMIPFTSPVVMLVRLPFDVAWWEIALSVAILVASFVGSTWMAGKIYRTGILMYGKKPSWRELWKWLRY